MHDVIPRTHRLTAQNRKRTLNPNPQHRIHPHHIQIVKIIALNRYQLFSERCIIHRFIPKILQIAPVLLPFTQCQTQFLGMIFHKKRLKSINPHCIAPRNIVYYFPALQGFHSGIIRLIVEQLPMIAIHEQHIQIDQQREHDQPRLQTQTQHSSIHPQGKT